MTAFSLLLVAFAGLTDARSQAVMDEAPARNLQMQLPEAWPRIAVHSKSGLLTLRQLGLQAVRHLRHHLLFIAEKRAALGAGQP